ncbi:MAG: hypothetical protein RLZZ609_1892 [Cyanobacteriota bacterium]|jgi:tetratricopeptide (TPR) repeat protein
MAATNPSAFRVGIFISYRRDDARGASGRVWDWLRIGFGRERVFRDVASIGAGKWREKIDQALAASKACVAVIGRRWADGTNLPRLQDPTDTVRYELETALASGERQELTVVPLLVEEAQLQEIPTAALPPSLQPLLGEWNVLTLTESGWDDDTRRLIEAIAAATGLPVLPDLEEWLELVTGAERGMAAQAQGQAQGAPMGGQRGEQQVLAEMLRRVAEAPASERPGLKAAFEAMAAGDSLLAEDMFEREVEASERLIAAASQLQAAEQGKKAEAAKNVGQLAVMRGDLSKAVRYFELALAAVPGDLETALQLGYAWIAQGSLQKAGDTFGDVITRARERQQERFEALGAIGQGDVRMAQGDGPGALAAYEAALAIREGLAKRDPANTQWQVDVAVSCWKLGSLDALLPIPDRRELLQRGREILTTLKDAGKLQANQDWIASFDQALAALP